MLQARELFSSTLQHQRHRRPILEGRCMYLGFKHHTQRIYQQMALSAAEFLSSVVSAYPSDAGCLHGLGVEDSALGWGSRPPRMRILSRNTALIFSQVPS